MFERECPYYLSIGMTYRQYWYGDPLMVRDFREADRIRKQQQNQFLWLQGRYIYEGVAVVLANAFGKKSAPKQDYPDKPYPLFERPKTQAEIERENEIERQRAHDYFAAVIQAFKERREGREIKEKI